MKTIVEVCKASGINFPLLYTHTIDMAIKSLNKEDAITATGGYKDGTYFSLGQAMREVVSQRAEEICIANRMLSPVLNKKFAASKQELRIVLVKGKDNYPRTILAVFNFLENHSLPTSKSNGFLSKNETSFVTDGE